MGKNALYWTGLVVVVLLLVACGAGAGSGAGRPDEGMPNPFAGRLVAEGSSKILTVELSSNSRWTERLDSSVYEVSTVNQHSNKLLAASVSYGSPLIIRSYDLSNFALVGTFVWPGTDERDVGRIHGLAVSPDGTHLAAVLSGIGDAFLEIVERDTREVKFRGHLDMAGNDLQWLNDDLLAVSAHVNDPSGRVAGGIVVASLSELSSGSDTVNLGLLVGFSADEWAGSKPFDFAFSNDFTQLVYAYNSDIWVKDLTDDSAPQQLTTGPTGLVGPVFSPDGSHIALVEYQRYTLRHTFVIPNHRTDPLFIDGLSAQTEAFLLQSATLVDTMLLWE